MKKEKITVLYFIFHLPVLFTLLVIALFMCLLKPSSLIGDRFTNMGYKLYMLKKRNKILIEIIISIYSLFIYLKLFLM